LSGSCLRSEEFPAADPRICYRAGVILGGGLDEVRVASLLSVARIRSGHRRVRVQRGVSCASGGRSMSTAKSPDLLSAGAIAKELGLSEAKVKKAIKELALAPKAKRGVCNLYGREILPKVKATATK
jgi:hypothetical protein